MKKSTVLQRHVNTLERLCVSQGKPAPDLERVASALVQLQRGLTDDRVLAGGTYMEEKALLRAYLLYYWPVSYQQVMRILRKLPAGAFGFLGKTGIPILDIGSGPGPASAAICDYLITGQGCEPASVSVCLADHSQKALSLAQSFFSCDFPSVSAGACACDLEKGFPPLGMTGRQQKFSIAIMSHSLNEMWKGDDRRLEKRTAFLQRLLDGIMEENSVLILCEPAQTKSSRELMSVRDALLSGRKDLDLLSPCPGAGIPCPALLQGEGATCHDEGGWQPVEPAARLARMAGLSRTSVKMSYFVFRKRAGLGTDAPEAQDAGEARDVADGSFTARVVSDAMLNKAGRTRFVLCDGKRRFSISAKKGERLDAEREFWNLSRGDLIAVTGAEARKSEGGVSFAVTAGTRIRLLG